MLNNLEHMAFTLTQASESPRGDIKAGCYFAERRILAGAAED